MIDIDDIAQHLSARGGLTLHGMIEIEPKIAESRKLAESAIAACLEDLATREGMAIDRAALRVIDDIEGHLPSKVVELKPLVARVAAYSSRSLGGSPPPIYESRDFPVEFGDPVGEWRSEFLLLEQVGAGYHGDVFRAIWRAHPNPTYHRVVAIKVLNPLSPLASSGIDLQTESVVASLVRSPNVVAVNGFVRTKAGEQAVVYEFVEGNSLHKILSPPIPVVSAVQLVMNATRGVADIHSRGALHCDIDSTNVMLADDGTVKIADLGLAVLKGDSAIEGPGLSQRVGAATFVSPEQFENGRVAASAQSDIYALGGLLYWLITGVYANDLYRCADRWYGLPAVPKSLRMIVDRALAMDPADRYGAAALMAVDLERWLRGYPIEWQRPGVLKRAALVACRHPLVAASLASCGIAIGVLGYTAGAIWLEREADTRTLEVQNEIRERMSRLDMAQQSAQLVLGHSVNKWAEAEIVSRETVMNIVSETIFGPMIWGDPLMLGQNFENRVELTRWRLERAPEGSFEELIFTTVLAEYLADTGESDEPRALVSQLRERYAGITSGDDPIWTKLEYIDALAALNGVDRADADAMRAVADRLEDILVFRGTSADNWSMKHGAASRLETVYGPEYLDDEAALDRVRPVLLRLRYMAELETKRPDESPAPVGLHDGLTDEQAASLLEISSEWVDMMTIRSASLFEKAMAARGGEPGRLWARVSESDSAWESIRGVHAESVTISRPTVNRNGVIVLRPSEGMTMAYASSLFGFGVPKAIGAAYVARQVCMPVTIRDGSLARVRLEYEWVADLDRWVPRMLFIECDRGASIPSKFIF